MNAELLAGLGGIVTSLAFSYVPGLNAWYGKLAPDRKRLTMMLVLLGVAGGAFGLTCAGWVNVPGLTCDEPGAFTALEALLAALVANQGTFLLTPKRI